MVSEERSGAELVSALRRWQDCGAVWRVLERHSSWAMVAMLRCDGGEEVERLASDDPGWLRFLDGRHSSED